ncbi:MULTISPECIES: ATP-binding protein [unclassified Leptolyngbya]|uniref:ATP-binding protein n=1 Tax=unclassified Leptolyngbya TaxID=2650499 RepID=UPI001685CB0C|nr:MULTISPECIES: ATP-binding protein [unclassified Leptolyngbya]MBD1911466.1 GAF domain-containing protein [Leptolyngbya sp. FACHB-8]MBD2153478.1 GAF domain-containing protein [Leptolyngbya sp. FACHB-16]
MSLHRPSSPSLPVRLTGDSLSTMTAFQTGKSKRLHYTLEETKEIHNHLPDGFISLDHDGYVVAINARAEQILCCDRLQVIGCLLWETIPEIAQPHGENACQRALEHQAEIHFEQPYEPYGLILEIVVSPHKGGLFLYLRDVTAHRKATASLQEHTRLSTLNTIISQVLAGSDPLPAMLSRCMQALVDELEGIALARIWTFDRESNFLDLRAIAGSISSPTDLAPRIPLGISIVGLIAQSRQPYRTNQLNREMCFELQRWATSDHLAAFVGYPLVVDDRLVGVITLLSKAPIREGTYAALQWIFNSMAIAIDRSVARAELLSRRESLLFRLASQIRNSLDLDTILGIAVQEIRQLFNIDGCHFLWCLMGNNTQAEILPTLAITHESIHPELPSLLGEHAPELGQSLVERILRLESLQLEDARNESTEEPGLQTWIETWGIQSFLLIPLETHSGQLGAIACSHCREPRHWSQPEVELLYAVTNQLAIAIDQAELYAQTRAAAFAAQAQAQQLNQTLQELRQTQAKMIQNEKMSSLGQLVAGIAHEINNPVGFVSGNLSYADTYFKDLVGLLNLYQKHYPEPNPEIQTYIKNIDLEFLLDDYASLLNSMKIGTERISKIVLSLRNFSRLDEAEVKAVDLHHGIDSTLLILQNRLKAHATSSAIEVVKNYGELPLIDCYASQLNQVFLNLLSNAIDALQDRSEPRTITITTSVRSACSMNESETKASDSRTDEPWVVVRIQDNGHGMAEDVRQKVFDPFFTTKPVGQGTGLGLSISHQIIVEKHHGWLTCESQAGQGTEFIIEIPAHLPPNF